MMRSRWEIGEAVRVVRNIRDDGTYPGAQPGQLLVRRGSIGTIVDIGTFLQDQVIYSVHFLDIDRVVGCREEEVIGGDEPWLPSRFEAREKVVATRILSLGPDARIPLKAVGEVLRVLRDGESPTYHVHFDCLPGRTLAVPESALGPLAGARDG